MLNLHSHLHEAGHGEDRHACFCCFVQVLRAQAAGALAAIVYDDAYEPLVIMDKLANMPEPGIPAIFVSQQTGVVMNRLLKAGITAAILLPVRP